MPSGKCRPYCLCLNVLIDQLPTNRLMMAPSREVNQLTASRFQQLQLLSRLGLFPWKQLPYVQCSHVSNKGTSYKLHHHRNVSVWSYTSVVSMLLACKCYRPNILRNVHLITHVLVVSQWQFVVVRSHITDIWYLTPVYAEYTCNSVVGMCYSMMHGFCRDWPMWMTAPKNNGARP